MGRPRTAIACPPTRTCPAATNCHPSPQAEDLLLHPQLQPCGMLSFKSSTSRPMRRTTSAKLLLSIVGIIILLLLTGPMIFAFGWQLTHGRTVTVNGLTFHLDRGWVVFHKSIIRIPDDVFLRDADDNFISVTPLHHCSPPQSMSHILANIRSAMEKRYSQPTFMTTIRVEDKYASCFEIHPNASSRTTETECITPGGQRGIGIHSTEPDRSEAIEMLQSAHETEPCTP